MQKKNRTSFRSSSRALALEPRLLFDGAGAVAAVDHFDTAGEHQAETQPQAAQPAADARPSEVAEKPANTGALVIVDSRVPDYLSLIDQLPADATVRVVGADESGLDVVGADAADGDRAFLALVDARLGHERGFEHGICGVNRAARQRQADGEHDGGEAHGVVPPLAQPQRLRSGLGCFP